MSAQVRRAELADVGALCGLIEAFEREFGHTVESGVDERLAAFIRDEHMVFLLVGAPPLGFTSLRAYPVVSSARPEAVLDDLYVVPAERGRGHGRALLQAAVAAARELGAGHLELTTTEEDVAAAALYRAEGLRETEEPDPGSGRVIWFGLEL